MTLVASDLAGVTRVSLIEPALAIENKDPKGQSMGARSNRLRPDWER
jgi:hypothetical protein